MRVGIASIVLYSDSPCFTCQPFYLAYYIPDVKKIFFNFNTIKISSRLCQATFYQLILPILQYHSDVLKPTTLNVFITFKFGSSNHPNTPVKKLFFLKSDICLYNPELSCALCNPWPSLFLYEIEKGIVWASMQVFILGQNWSDLNITF